MKLKWMEEQKYVFLLCGFGEKKNKQKKIRQE